MSDIDKTGLMITVVLLFVVATVGILVVGEIGDEATTQFEDADNRTASPYDGEDYQPLFHTWSVLVAAIVLSPALFFGLAMLGGNEAGHKEGDTSIEEGDADE